MNTNLFSAEPDAAAGSKDQSRARVKIAVFSVLAVHVAGLVALLLTQGCRRETPPDANVPSPDAPIVTNMPPVTDPGMDPTMTNLPPYGEVMTNTPGPIVEPLPVATATTYKIKKGDSFYTIAREFHVTQKAIEAANPGVDPRKLQINQEITIPAPTAPALTPMVTDGGGPTTYKVVSGDTLSGIAKKFSTTVKAIQQLNGLTTTSIKAGQTLKVPVKPAPAPAPEPPPVTPITPLPPTADPTTPH